LRLFFVIGLGGGLSGQSLFLRSLLKRGPRVFRNVERGAEGAAAAEQQGQNKEKQKGVPQTSRLPPSLLLLRVMAVGGEKFTANTFLVHQVGRASDAASRQKRRHAI
jgi:hypothetical protein